MKFFRTIRRIVCLTAALAVFASACLAEGTYEIAEEGLELTEELSVHYPVLSGGADKALTEQVNGLIREKCRIGEYMTRMALLLSGGSLEADWKGGLLNDVFSCAVFASGAVEDTRPTYVWTAVTADLRDGHEITFEELFTDADTAREKIRAYLEETVAPELSAHLLNSELTPLPEQFYLERSGIMLLYPVEQLSTLSDRAGDIRVGWNVVKDELNPEADGIPARIGALDAAVLTELTNGKVRSMPVEPGTRKHPIRYYDWLSDGDLRNPDNIAGAKAAVVANFDLSGSLEEGNKYGAVESVSFGGYTIFDLPNPTALAEDLK
jgi:hypothetical protein